MHQGHPFRTGVRKITETKPPTSLRRPVVGVRIVSDPKGSRAKPEIDRIESLLSSVTEPSTVRLLDIEFDCRLDRVPQGAARFSELEYAHVAGRRIVDYSALAPLRNIKSLFVTNYTEPTLWPMDGLSLDSFRSIADRLETCSLSAGTLWLQRSTLRRFTGGTVAKLQVEKCNNLDLATIAALEGLEELQIMSMPKLLDFGFLSRCSHLKRLEVYSRLRGTNVDELKRSRTLEWVLIQLPSKLIREVGVANPNIAISNGDTCFIGGQPADHFKEFFAYRRK
jgi:hypothetical protein